MWPNTHSWPKIPYLPSDHSNHLSQPTLCGQTPTHGQKFPISLPTTQTTSANLHYVAKHPLMAKNSLSPFRPLKPPQPTYTMWPNTHSWPKIPYLPSDHSNHLSQPTLCGQTPTHGQKFPISLPTTQ